MVSSLALTSAIGTNELACVQLPPVGLPEGNFGLLLRYVPYNSKILAGQG